MKSEAADNCDSDDEDFVDDDDEVNEDEDEERALGTAAAGRCSPLDVSTSICGSRWPRTGLLSPVSPNQKTGSVPPADWSSTATVKTAIGQPARVTHGYRLHQQHLRSIFAALLPGPAYYSSTSRTHAAINTYVTPQGGILEVRATALLPSPTPPLYGVARPLYTTSSSSPEGLRGKSKASRVAKSWCTPVAGAAPTYPSTMIFQVGPCDLSLSRWVPSERRSYARDRRCICAKIISAMKSERQANTRGNAESCFHKGTFGEFRRLALAYIEQRSKRRS